MTFLELLTLEQCSILHTQSLYVFLRNTQTMTCILSSRHIIFASTGVDLIFIFSFFDYYPWSSIIIAVCMLQIRCLTFNLGSQHLSTLWCKLHVAVSIHRNRTLCTRLFPQVFTIDCCYGCYVEISNFLERPYQSYIHADLSEIAANGILGELRTLSILLSCCKLWHYDVHLGRA